MAQGKRGPLAVAGGRADLRDHGAAYGYSRWRRSGCFLFGRGRITARRNDPDVPVDERLSFGAVAEADRQGLAKCDGGKKAGRRGACREIVKSNLSTVIAKRSDEAIHSFFVWRDGLLRFARNDGEKASATQPTAPPPC